MAEKNFIDFILATEKDEKLLTKFLEYKTPGRLQNFFSRNGYTVTKEDCKKLITAKENLGITDGVIPPAY